MNLIPHKMNREHTVEPLHQVLLSFGKGLWQWPLSKSRSEHGLSDMAQDMLLNHNADSAALQARVRELTIKQVATTVRMQDPHEDLGMLASLESLVLAGEIAFADYIGRLQNLYPKAMSGMDVSLRMKIASLML